VGRLVGMASCNSVSHWCSCWNFDLRRSLPPPHLAEIISIWAVWPMAHPAQHPAGIIRSRGFSDSKRSDSDRLHHASFIQRSGARRCSAGGFFLGVAQQRSYYDATRAPERHLYGVSGLSIPERFRGPAGFQQLWCRRWNHHAIHPYREWRRKHYCTPCRANSCPRVQCVFQRPRTGNGERTQHRGIHSCSSVQRKRFGPSDRSRGPRLSGVYERWFSDLRFHMDLDKRRYVEYGIYRHLYGSGGPAPCRASTLRQRLRRVGFAWMAQEKENSRACVSKAANWISERPPRGGLSVLNRCPLMALSRH